MSRAGPKMASAPDDEDQSRSKIGEQGSPQDDDSTEQEPDPWARGFAARPHKLPPEIANNSLARFVLDEIHGRAAIKGGVRRLGNRRTRLERGQCVVSSRALAQKFGHGVTRKQVRTVLSLLKRIGAIEVRGQSRWTLVTARWLLWLWDGKGPTEGPTEGPTADPDLPNTLDELIAEQDGKGPSKGPTEGPQKYIATSSTSQTRVRGHGPDKKEQPREPERVCDDDPTDPVDHMGAPSHRDRRHTHTQSDDSALNAAARELWAYHGKRYAEAARALASGKELLGRTPDELVARLREFAQDPSCGLQLGLERSKDVVDRNYDTAVIHRHLRWFGRTSWDAEHYWRSFDRLGTPIEVSDDQKWSIEMAALRQAATDEAHEVLDYLIEASGRDLNPDDPNHLDIIQQRLNAGATVADMKLVVQHRVAEWSHTDEDLRRYLRPRTLFRDEHWDDYLVSAREWNEPGASAADEAHLALSAYYAEQLDEP